MACQRKIQKILRAESMKILAVTATAEKEKVPETIKTAKTTLLNRKTACQEGLR